MVRPPCTRVATPVTSPAETPRWCVALISMPTVKRSGPACSADPSEPSVSASTQEAPPCSSPYGCVLPGTGMEPTTRSAEASRILMPIRLTSVSAAALEKISLICRSRSVSTAASEFVADDCSPHQAA